MKLSDFIAVMERIAPPELALDYDNVGLLIDPGVTEVKRVLVALDCTPITAREAADAQCDLLLTHHPLFFHPIQRLTQESADAAAACILIRGGVAHYAAHTNLDAAAGGVNDCLSEVLQLRSVRPLPPEDLGRLGETPPEPLAAFAARAAKLLSTAVRICDAGRPVQRVALIGGAGGSDVRAAYEAGADTLLTGEMRHNQAQEARFLGLNAIEAGHYETERVVLLPLIRRLQMETNDVQYNLTHLEAACLGRL